MSTSQGKAASAVVRARMSAHLKGAGYAVPLDLQPTHPLVTWRVKPCNCRVLRVFLTPDGWQLLGDRFRVSAREWFERVATSAPSSDGGVPLTLESERAGLIFATNKRKVAGVSRLLPPDVAAWPGAAFEVGCRHGHDYRPLVDVASDCEQALGTRAPTMRDITWQSGNVNFKS